MVDVPLIQETNQTNSGDNQQMPMWKNLKESSNNNNKPFE